MWELGQRPGANRLPAFTSDWHHLPYGAGNGGFVAAVPLSERTREAGSGKIVKQAGDKWCRMQQLGPGRLHRSLVSSQTHSQWTLWGLWLGRKCCGHGRSLPDRHWWYYVTHCCLQLSAVVTKKQTMAHIERDMARWIKVNFWSSSFLSTISFCVFIFSHLSSSGVMNGNSCASWDHTVSPATQQRWHSRLYPSQI